LQEVIGRVVDAGNDVGETFRVGSPLNDDLAEIVLGLELASQRGLVVCLEHSSRTCALPNVGSDLFKMLCAGFGALEDVVCS
jgi:hypothetical protein